MNDILFSETQRFRKWWIWVLLIGINALNFFQIYNQAANSRINFFGTTIGILITLLFLYIRLETVIKPDGIYVRFFPVQIKFKYFSWETILKCYVRQYNPIAEYGGWGLRLGIFGRGKAYNISGNEGLQLEFADDKKLLIGTNRPEELTAALAALHQYKE